jgi:regulator of PEP synthase PpsR (kinase-PPPase family)
MATRAAGRYNQKTMMAKESDPENGRRIVIISDGTGETAAQMTKAAMVQFRDHDVYFTRYKNVRTESQLEAICQDAAKNQDLIV